jgi:hypothetical protein
MRYLLRDKEPINIKLSQEMAIKMDKNMQASSKSNLPGFAKGIASTPKQEESKGKAVAFDSKDSSNDYLNELKEIIKTMEVNHVAKLNAMQNQLITMEISQAHRLHPKGNGNWRKKGHPQEQRPPNQLETMNMVNEEAPPFCRACEDFHESSTCPIFFQINEQGFIETSNYVGYSRRFYFIINVGKTHYVTNDQWK